MDTTSMASRVGTKLLEASMRRLISVFAVSLFAFALTACNGSCGCNQPNQCNKCNKPNTCNKCAAPKPACGCAK